MKLSLVALSLALVGSAACAQPASTPAKKIEPAPAAAPKKEKKEPTLKVGSEAPALTVTKWVQGSEVKNFEKGKVYVVEFWATWCPPCKKSIPHLSELSKKYKDITFIGMASSEHKTKGATEDTRLPTLEKFVKDTSNKLDYPVAYDADSKMSETWMAPAGQGGIPCAFIVNGEGKLAYIGHPMDDKFETTLKGLAKSSESESHPADAKAPASDKKHDVKHEDKSKK